MSNFLQIVGFFALAAGVSFGLSLFVFGGLARRRSDVLAPGSAVRLRTPDGVYRTRYAGSSRQGLVFAAPLQRDAYVPISVGATVTVEAPSDKGILLFRSRVAARSTETHELILEAPDRVFQEDRREHDRDRGSDASISVEHAAGWLCDQSPNGLRFRSDRRFESGERVRIDLPGRDEPEFAWVLQCGPNFDGGKGAYTTRVRLESAS